MDTKQIGLVIKSQSGFYTVQTAVGQITAQIPGRMKKKRQQSTIVAVGDQVTLSINDDGTGKIEEISERKSVLARSRTSAGPRSLTSDTEQVLVANPDQVIFVFALKNPLPSLRKLDRFLVVAEMNGLPAIICINKIDLGQIEKARKLFRVYTDIGYDVIYTSVTENVGIDVLRARLQAKISVFTGSSGVGKSSLLNAVQSNLGLQVSSVSDATGKGMHTTRHAEMFPLQGGGYVVDTPGIRGLALFDLAPEEVDAYFREIAPLVPNCRFSDCTHKHEPGCAVRTAVKNGTVSAARYDSYLRLREEHEILEQSLY